MENIIDASGKPCPIPVIEAKKALRGAVNGDRVCLVVDNDVSCRNLEKMANGMGFPFSSEQKTDGKILITITVIETKQKENSNGATSLVIAIGKNTMGSGNDDLGAILIKGFIYSLTELDTPPETILFFNSGVRLTTNGSTVIADLKKLEEKGTIIASCGTCLDFYGLKEKLEVGNITNMYAIVQSMAGAGRLISIP